MRRLASEVSRRLRDASRIREWVRPVIVVLGDFPQQVAGDTVTYVYGDHVTDWLRAHAQRLAQPQQDRLNAHIQRNWNRDN